MVFLLTSLPLLPPSINAFEDRSLFNIFFLIFWGGHLAEKPFLGHERCLHAYRMQIAFAAMIYLFDPLSLFVFHLPFLIRCLSLSFLQALAWSGLDSSPKPWPTIAACSAHPWELLSTSRSGSECLHVGAVVSGRQVSVSLPHQTLLLTV